MKLFRIMQAGTGVILWTGSAPDAVTALDALANAAGSDDHHRAGGLHVEEVGAAGAEGARPSRFGRRALNHRAAGPLAPDAPGDAP